MISPIGIVELMGKNDMMDDYLKQEGNLTIQPIDQGFEAEVIKISPSSPTLKEPAADSEESLSLIQS